MWPTALFAGPAGKLRPSTLSPAATRGSTSSWTWTLKDGLSANHAALRTSSRTCLHGTPPHRTATLPLWCCHGPSLLSLDRGLIHRARAGLRRNHAALGNDRLL